MTKAVRGILRATTFRWLVNTAASFVVNLGLTIGLHEGFGVATEIAYAVALVAVFLMNFAFFRYYVFVQEEPLPIRAQFVAYTGSAVGFRLSEYAGFLVMHTLLGVHYVIAIVLVQGAAFVAKYFFYGKLVFRGRNAG